MAVKKKALGWELITDLDGGPWALPLLGNSPCIRKSI